MTRPSLPQRRPVQRPDYAALAADAYAYAMADWLRSHGERAAACYWQRRAASRAALARAML